MGGGTLVSYFKQLVSFIQVINDSEWTLKLFECTI